MRSVYNDLPHPPESYLGRPPTTVSRHEIPSAPGTAIPNDNDVTPTPLDGSVAATNVTLPPSARQPEYTKANTWNFRSADGSYYAAQTPAMGMARTPYARSVASKEVVNKADLPDANELFEKLLRRDKFEEHPGGISSLFFAFANLVIHSIFNTSHEKNGYVNNNVSSYLDLSPLYGSSVEEQLRVRKSDGTGMLWEDSFSDSRLLFMPPSSGALLVLLSRNHNVGTLIFLRTCCALLTLYAVHCSEDSRHQREWHVPEPTAFRRSRSEEPGRGSLPTCSPRELRLLHADHSRRLCCRHPRSGP